MLHKYHVTYFYLTTGMEGIAHTEDYGIIEAESREAATEIVTIRELPEDKLYGPNKTWSTRDFFRGCLRADLI